MCGILTTLANPMRCLKFTGSVAVQPIRFILIGLDSTTLITTAIPHFQAKTYELSPSKIMQISPKNRVAINIVGSHRVFIHRVN